MIRNFPLLVLGAAALAACNPKPETLTARDDDPMAEELANAAPVELPPAIAASKTYRCKDNSLVTIDWMQGGKAANLRVGKSTTPTALAAASEGEGLSAADGTKLSGSATAGNVSLTLPGKGAQSCKA